jgi:ABC-2 type transport system ATP-binding protein
MERMIRELTATGSTVLMNTHRLAEAERLCDRVAILRHGHLLELGTPGQLRDRLLGGVVRVELATPPDNGLRHLIDSMAGLSHVEWRPRSFSCRLANANSETPRQISRLVHAGADILSVAQAGDLEQAYLELMARTESPELEAAA